MATIMPPTSTHPTTTTVISGENSPAEHGALGHAVILPGPDQLNQLIETLPGELRSVLEKIAFHRCTNFSELSTLIWGDWHVSVPLGMNLELRTAKEVAYDIYFNVGRTALTPRLSLARACLTTVKNASLNASQGHTLSPAEEADLLRAVRLMATLVLSQEE